MLITISRLPPPSPSPSYEAGQATLPGAFPSAVITRDATLAENLAGTEEYFVPARYLAGLLPAVLVDGHAYWMVGRPRRETRPRREPW